jgi:hypothetical protein
MAITLRSGLGRKLTISEMDENFTFLSSSYVVNSVTASMTAGSASVATRANGLAPTVTASFADTTTSSSIATTAQTSSVATRANTLASTATAASASTAVLAQTASVATRANGLAPTVTATSASTAIAAQTASVATRANALAPTVTATSASVAARATTLSAQATASFADVAGTVHDGNITATKIATDAVITAKILNSNVTNAKLANDSVTIGSTEVDLGATAASLTGLTSISAQTGSFVLQVFESASTIITSGSNIFGDKAADIQQITGSLLQTGSMTVIGNISASVGGFSGSFQGDGTLLTGVVASGSIQSASVAARATTLSPAATAASASTAILAQTASVAGRANDLAPTVTATSASTAIAAQTASVAGRANDLAPTVTATSASTAVLAQTASVATRANGLAPTVTASYADKADEAVTSNVIPVTVVNDGGNKYAFNGVTAPTLSLNRGELYRFDLSDATNDGHPFAFRLLDDTSYAVGVTTVGTAGNTGAYVDFDVNFATSASLRYYCTTHGNGMGNRAQIVDVLGGITSGSFSGSYQGDGSNITAVSAISSSTAVLAQTASVATRANGLAPTVTASFADLASNVRNLSISGSGAISGSLLVTGSSALAIRVSGSTALTGSLLHSGSIVSSGSLLQSGSTQITGSTLLSGSLTITGSSAIGLRMSGSTALTGSIFQTGSFNVTGSSMLSGSVSITGSTNIIGAVSSSDDGRFKSLGINVAPSGVAGAILATNDVVAFASSDERLKENLEPIGSAVEKVEQITGYTYNWIPMEDIHVYGDMKDIGVIAQEVEKVLPEIVSDRENGYKAIKYDKLTAVLIQAVKELSDRVKTLENK